MDERPLIRRLLMTALLAIALVCAVVPVYRMVGCAIDMDCTGDSSGVMMNDQTSQGTTVVNEWCGGVIVATSAAIAGVVPSVATQAPPLFLAIILTVMVLFASMILISMIRARHLHLSPPSTVSSGVCLII